MVYLSKMGGSFHGNVSHNQMVHIKWCLNTYYKWQCRSQFRWPFCSKSRLRNNHLPDQCWLHAEDLPFKLSVFQENPQEEGSRFAQVGQQIWSIWNFLKFLSKGANQNSDFLWFEGRLKIEKWCNSSPPAGMKLQSWLQMVAPQPMRPVEDIFQVIPRHQLEQLLPRSLISRVQLGSNRQSPEMWVEIWRRTGVGEFCGEFQFGVVIHGDSLRGLIRVKWLRPEIRYPISWFERSFSFWRLQKLQWTLPL